jgi:ribosomal protein S18 acetylase RimI-like enzyme
MNAQRDPPLFQPPPVSPPLDCRSSSCGQGLGARLIDWAGAHVASRNRRYLRLDCGAENASIRAYYEDLQFQHVRDVEVAISGAGSTNRPWRASLYERAIAKMDAAH